MTRRILHALLALVMMLTVIPFYPMGVGAASSGNNFIFENLPEIVNYKYLSLEGTLNQVSPIGVSYTVTPKNGTEGPQKTTGVIVSDDGRRIRVANIELFPGENTITFRGKNGASEITSSIKVTYIDTPLLYNLQFKSGSQKLPLNEQNATVVTKRFTTSNDIFTIEGNAPNVTKVIVESDGDSRSAFVNESADNYFIISQLKLKKGKNVLTFKLTNKDQVIESKREVIYFDGSATFFDTKVSVPDSTGKVNDYDLKDFPMILSQGTPQPADFTFTGDLMIPVDSSFTPAASTVEIMKVRFFEGSLSGTAKANITFKDAELTKQPDGAEYHHYRYTFKGNQLLEGNPPDDPAAPKPGAPAVFPFDIGKRYTVAMDGFNPVQSNKETSNVYDTNSDFGYTIKDDSKFQITGAEYIQSDKIPTGNDKGNKFDANTTINKLPFSIALLTKNLGAVNKITVHAIGQGGGKVPVTVSPATGTIRGERLWFTIRELPVNGTQTLEIEVEGTTGNDSYSIQVTSASGPVQEFSKIKDGQVFDYDPTITGYEDKLVSSMKEFEGTVSNVELDAASYTNGTIKLTLNNSDIPLEPKGDNYHFKMKSGTKVSFIEGQNTLVFKYKKGNVLYEKTYKITLLSNNYPEIPKGGTEGIYPYATEKPSKDNRFTGKDGVYTTKEKKMNIFGTFDFIDLPDSTAGIEARLNDMEKDIEAGNEPKYVLEIKSSDDKYDKKWILGKNKLLIDGKDTWGSKEVDNLEVKYLKDKKYFTFILSNIELPKDGTKLVYTFTVYNNGVNGTSKSTARLEVRAPGLMYDIVRPILPRQATLNQNFVEVVIDAPGADSITFGKNNVATKVDYDSDMDGKIDYPNAFRAIITDLKPNKANKISFTVKSASGDVVNDSFEVFYALSTIPGSQHMAPMTAKTNIFEKQLNLTFPKDTYLVRYDYNVPENLRGQVFKGHNILYGIANKEDGVIDRFDYLQERPKNFDDVIQDLGRDFEHSFDSHFIKASNVFWMDAGLADDPGTKEDYDPYPYGMLPIMPRALTDSLKLYNFNDVPVNRVLVPNKRGTLELAYDPNVVSDASNHLTVMRYDPNKFFWENLGGKVNVSKKTISVPFDKFGYYVVAKLNDSFVDVVTHQYARNQVEAMFAKGVIKSDNEVEFKPDTDTTRGEFAAMVVRALQLPLVDNPPTQSFVDVPFDYNGTQKYDYRHIETAARLGIVRGKEPKIFEPNSKITREEVAVILARALKLKTETNAAKTKANLTKLFKDAPLVDAYAAPAVVEIAKKKLIIGSPVDPNDTKKGYVFEPKANMLRGDAAILMARVMAMQKLIPAVTEVK
ncbi:S-layer homology domain-containing protein [Brevibacillus laterosporus]|uniref:S-layer homology domain-containing protein n=1 Tax=Brevibacillus laterosporus TaxID=1465 RepID=UPI000CE3B74E|nr:S-layer homology domain-containing protein [Brevibacillus laterosporus]PPA83997.1 S-layer homology domain-containing protein [Brevibacillus laterosporus]